MTPADELNKLKQMLDDGTITEEQYERARAKLLGEAAERPVEAEFAEEAEPASRPEERRPRRARRRYDDEDDTYDDYDDRPRRKSRKQRREYCMLLHLSLFAGHAVPLGGIIAPLIIWQTQKDEIPEIDEHGRNAMNWIITNLVYLLIIIPLCFVIVGIPLLIALGVLNIVFPVIAAMKANEGQVWAYPLTLRFL